MAIPRERANAPAMLNPEFSEPAMATPTAIPSGKLWMVTAGQIVPDPISMEGIRRAVNMAFTFITVQRYCFPANPQIANSWD